MKEMHLVIVSPEQVVFDGKVTQVTLPGEQGKFQVLSGHAAIISSLVEGEVNYTVGKDTQVMKITGGFAEIKDNEISVCAEL